MKTWIIVLLVLLIAGISYIVLSHVYDFVDNITSSIRGSQYTFNSFDDAIDSYLSVVKTKPTLVYESCIPIYWHSAIKKHKLKTVKIGDRIISKDIILVDCDGCSKESNPYSNRHKIINPILSDITHCSSIPTGKSYIYHTDAGTVMYITDVKMRSEFMQKEIKGDNIKVEKQNIKLPAYEAFEVNEFQVPKNCETYISKVGDMIMWDVNADIPEYCKSLIIEH